MVARVDADRREGIRRAHSATHLLHYALQKNLGEHAQQQGSKVDDDWLRFDFTHQSPVETEQLDAIESDVNERVAAAEPIRWDVLPLEQARQRGAMMLFGEKYPDPVRMVSMGQFSRELCGGTHLENTADVILFDLVAEEGVAAGTRRVVALTGRKAEENIERTKASLAAAAQSLAVAPGEVPATVKWLSQRVRDLKKQLSGGAKAPAPPAKKTAPPPADQPTYRADQGGLARCRPGAERCPLRRARRASKPCRPKWISWPVSWPNGLPVENSPPTP